MKLNEVSTYYILGFLFYLQQLNQHVHIHSYTKKLYRKTTKNSINYEKKSNNYFFL